MKKIIKIVKKFRLIIFIGLIAFIVSGFLLFKYRSNFHWYQLAYVYLIKDRSDVLNMLEEDHAFFPEDKSLAPEQQIYRLKWYFRPQARIHSQGGFSAEPLVFDTDKDGNPEVYWTSYSKKVYSLDGKTGKRLWYYQIPFAVSGSSTLRAQDVDNDFKKELIFGTHWTLPIRVYCLKTDKNIENRLLWVTNVHGDFIEGGLNTCKLADGTSRIIATTRDAPYSRGSLNILDGRGKFVVPPISGLDVCLSHPNIADINGDGEMDIFIHGSHNFYGAKYGWKIVSRSIVDGKLLWQKDVKRDTGYQQHFIADINYDGEKEVIVAPDPVHDRARDSIILNAQTGEEIKRFEGEIRTFFKTPAGEIYILCQLRDKKSACINYQSGEEIYRFNPLGYTHILDIDQDGLLEILCEDYRNNTIKIIIIDALTGEKEGEYSINHSNANLANPRYSHEFPSLLADCDNDGYWELLTKINDYICAFDLPFLVN